jgi:hypothetical protein
MERDGGIGPMFDLSASVSDDYRLVCCTLTLGSAAIHWNQLLFA